MVSVKTAKLKSANIISYATRNDIMHAVVLLAISFSLIRSAVMCLRGAGSSLHHPARSTEEAPLDLAIHEGRTPTL